MNLIDAAGSYQAVGGVFRGNHSIFLLSGCDRHIKCISGRDAQSGGNAYDDDWVQFFYSHEYGQSKDSQRSIKRG